MRKDFKAISTMVVFSLLLLTGDPALSQDMPAKNKDIYSLRGNELPGVDSLVFADYTIRNGGGYMLPVDSRFPGQYSMGYWNSDNSLFYVFVKWIETGSSTKQIVTDILEIKKNELLSDHRIIDQLCSTGKPDPEIIAIVKEDRPDPDYYTKIRKAWRAHRKTGKFEKVKTKKVKRCYNESSGI